MRKEISPMDYFVRFTAHGLAAFLSMSALAPITLKPAPQLTRALLSGSDQGYILPGSQFQIFKPYLPARGRYSLILDGPNDISTKYRDTPRYKQSIKYKEASYDAQNSLAPVIINLIPEEPMALVYCSDDAVAAKRLEETGYEWTYSLAPGKGLARKKKT